MAELNSNRGSEKVDRDPKGMEDDSLREPRISWPALSTRRATTKLPPGCSKIALDYPELLLGSMFFQAGESRFRIKETVLPGITLPPHQIRTA